MAASAKRNGSHIISVIIGADDSKGRFATITQQFEKAFANYETKNVLKKDSILEKVAVIGGKAENISVYPERPYFVFCKKGDVSDVSVSINLPESINAPTKKGDVIGSVTVTEKGRATVINLLSLDTVEALSYWDITQNIMRAW